MNVFELKVFPPADVFPMMPADEMQELALDVEKNGLHQPIVVASIDGEMMLVDGRNRREACKHAGIEPKVIELNGEDPTAYVISANIARRHMTKGQRAMAVAIIYPDAARVKRKGSGSSKMEDLSAKSISYARTVYHHAPDLTDSVLNGSVPLHKAYEEAKARQAAARGEDMRLARLRSERPDLADMVVEEQMTVEEALKRRDEEAEAKKQERWAATMNIIDSVRPLDRDVETASEHIALFDVALAQTRGEDVSPERLRRAATYLNALADEMENV